MPTRPLHRAASKSGGASEFAGDGLGRHRSPRRGHLLFPRSSLFFKIGLVAAVAVVFVGVVSWAFFSTSGFSINAGLRRGYRRLQEKLAAELVDLEEIAAVATGLSKEFGFCERRYENYVPCYYDFTESSEGEENSDGAVEYVRRCSPERRIACSVPPPPEYRIPLRWPRGRDVIWKDNVKISGHEFSSGSLTKRMMVEEEQISFRSDSYMVDGMEDYAHQIAEMIGLRNESNFNEAGVRTILDIDCGFGSFGAHLFSKQLLTLCVANYEASGSQIQITLERGLPAIIGSFSSGQLPFPFLSFDMVHCARCGIEWEKKDGLFLTEVDRLLKPGGYFVWTSLTNTHRYLRDKEIQKKWNIIHGLAENLCWELLAQQDETVVWRKTSTRNCYSSRSGGPAICAKVHDTESPYYKELSPCLAGTTSLRWIPVEYRSKWPSRATLNSSELKIYGVHREDFAADALKWNFLVQNYWTLLSPLIFSDHPKRPGEEEPHPPHNIVRNVLDMNAHFGGFNAALLDAGLSVWVMNVVPTNARQHLPLIFDRGFVGVRHDWCESFPSYPRTYDLVHAAGLISLERNQKHRCSLFDIFLEVDRILRPEGWVILRDTAPLIEAARPIAAQLKWDARMLDLDISSDEKLLICQKLFFRNPLR